MIASGCNTNRAIEVKATMWARIGNIEDPAYNDPEILHRRPKETRMNFPGLWTFIGLILCSIAIGVAPYFLKSLDAALP